MNGNILQILLKKTVVILYRVSNQPYDSKELSMQENVYLYENLQGTPKVKL